MRLLLAVVFLLLCSAVSAECPSAATGESIRDDATFWSPCNHVVVGPLPTEWALVSPPFDVPGDLLIAIQHAPSKSSVILAIDSEFVPLVEEYGFETIALASCDQLLESLDELAPVEGGSIQINSHEFLKCSVIAENRKVGKQMVFAYHYRPFGEGMQMLAWVYPCDQLQTCEVPSYVVAMINELHLGP